MRTRLRHVAQVNPLSRRFDRLADDELVTFLPMENVWPGDMLDLSQVRPKSSVAVGYTRFESGDVVVPKITPTFEASRSVLIPEIPHSVGVGTTELHVVRPSEYIDPRFLLYIFHSHDFLKIGESELYGVAGQKRVPDDLIRDWLIDLPSINEQRRIADFLDAETARIDHLQSVRDRQSQVLQELASSRISAIIHSGSEMPFVRLGYLATIQSGVTVDSNRDAGTNSVTLPYLRVANVQDGHVDLDSITEITVPKSVARSSKLRNGDVLMTEGGDLDKLGRGTVWLDEIQNCLHQNHVFAVRPDQSKLVPEYLALITRTAYARAYFESTGTKTTNLASTSSSKIRDFKIPLREIAEQIGITREIDGWLADLMKIQRGLDRQLSLLAERRQALITAAVTGQIDVTTARGGVT
jgi:type I restriction enzyme S subunit